MTDQTNIADAQQAELRAMASRRGIMYYYYDDKNVKRYVPVAKLREWLNEATLNPGTIPPDRQPGGDGWKEAEAARKGRSGGGSGTIGSGEGPGDPVRDALKAALAGRGGNGDPEPDKDPDLDEEQPVDRNEEPKRDDMPPVYPAILRRAKQTLPNGMRHNILMFGESGAGKTHMAAAIAEELGLNFAELSCSIGMSEGNLLGRLLPTGEHGRFEYHPSTFVTLFEDGGVFLLDEIGAADPNTVVVLNSALSNGRLSVPARTDAPTAFRDPNFVFFGSDNTRLDGATREFTARMAQDMAFTDRFQGAIFEVERDKGLEKRLVPQGILRRWASIIRKRIAKHGIERRMLSMRALIKYQANFVHGDRMEDIERDFFALWDHNERERMGDTLTDLRAGKRS